MQTRKEKLEHEYSAAMDGSWDTTSEGFDRLSELCPLKSKKDIKNFRENFDKFLDNIKEWNLKK